MIVRVFDSTPSMEDQDEVLRANAIAVTEREIAILQKRLASFKDGYQSGGPAPAVWDDFGKEMTMTDGNKRIETMDEAQIKLED